MSLSPTKPGDDVCQTDIGRPLRQKCLTHNSVTLQWDSVSDCKTYIIEEKDQYGIGKVYVGNATECTLMGLEPLSGHNYRMRCLNDDNNFSTPWLQIFTSKEPVSCEHLIRACSSSGQLQKLKKSRAFPDRSCI